MGLGGISVWQLLIILAIVVLVFGTKRLKNLGGDLGGALKSFRKAMDSDEDKGGDDAAEGDTKQIRSDEAADAEFSEQRDKQKEN
jgi:sec-independent protein translocase protein TatA